MKSKLGFRTLYVEVYLYVVICWRIRKMGFRTLYVEVYLAGQVRVQTPVLAFPYIIC